MNPFRRRRAATTPDPFAGRADDDLLGFADLAAAGVNPREALHMGLEGVLDPRQWSPDRPGKGVTVASARRYLANRGEALEERIVYRPTPPGEVR